MRFINVVPWKTDGPLILFDFDQRKLLTDWTIDDLAKATGVTQVYQGPDHVGGDGIPGKKQLLDTLYGKSIGFCDHPHSLTHNGITQSLGLKMGLNVFRGMQRLFDGGCNHPVFSQGEAL